MLQKLAHRRLIFVTGKGGTGKTTLVTSLGMHLASLGHKVLLAEVDNARPTLGGYFDRDIGYSPVRVGVNLDAVNLDFANALRSYLERVVPVQRLVRLILRNKIVRTFLFATPGARETVILGQVNHLYKRTAERPGDDSGDRRDWDHLIVDMPASGHAVSLFGTPLTIQKLFRVGPLRNEAETVLTAFSDEAHVALVMISIAEEMSINETLETMDKVRGFGWPPLTGVVLNRHPAVAFDGDERAALRTLEAAVAEGAPPGNVDAVVDSAAATRIAQRRSDEALARLEQAVDGAVHRVPFVSGGSVEVARGLAEILGQLAQGEGEVGS